MALPACCISFGELFADHVAGKAELLDELLPRQAARYALEHEHQENAVDLIVAICAGFFERGNRFAENMQISRVYFHFGSFPCLLYIHKFRQFVSLGVSDFLNENKDSYETYAI